MKHERNHELLDIKIWQYLLPAIMMKLALQLGNVVDTMLVGNLLGPDAMSSVTLSVPVISLIQIPGYFLGNGGAIAASIFLGKRQKKEAREVFSVTFIITAVFGFIFLVSAFFITDPLAHLLSKGGSLEPAVADYVFVCLAGAPIIGIALLMTAFFAGDSHPKLASAYFIISNAVNLLLDYIFLKFTPLGVTGAALSTMIGFFVGFVVLIPYIRSKKRMISFTKPRIRGGMIKNVFKTGMPYLTYLVMQMIKYLAMNAIVLTLLGEIGMAVYTVCTNAEMILAMLIGGVVGIIPSIAGILYGEKDYYGIHALFKKVIRIASILTGSLMIVVFIFADFVAGLFGIDEASVKETMVFVLRIYVFAMPFNMWNCFGMQYYASVEKSPLATCISALENGALLIPATLVGILLTRGMKGGGYVGLAIAFVVAEVLTVLIGAVFRRIKYKDSSILLVPETSPGVSYDFTIRADLDEALCVPREIRSFCEEHGVDKSKANLIAVAAEEMTVNIVNYGGGKSKWIDVCLTVLEATDEETAVDENPAAPDDLPEETSTLMLRIRDNGIPFDPTNYEYDNKDNKMEEMEIGGIELAKKAAKEMTYVRAIDLNNTTITV